MQSPHRFLTTPHRRRRLALWALAMLAWITAVLFADKPITTRRLRQRGERMSLKHLTRLTIDLIIVRAAELARRRHGKHRFWKRGRDLRRPHLKRSLVGSRLRRLLKRGGLGARIARLTGVLRNLERYAQQLAKRFRHRLTRLFAIIATPTPAPLAPVAPPLAPALADSS